jgi:hypothetical protein
MTQRIRENFSAPNWRLVTIMATPCRRETPTMTMIVTKTTIPNQTTSASRRSLENPTKTNKREANATFRHRILVISLPYSRPRVFCSRLNSDDATSGHSFVTRRSACRLLRTEA